jgi:putative ubiquitin-RnfH superfamily antitoxin RatB of RatAB toxin-antitoxin module
VTIRVEVVHALPEEQHVLPLELDDHAVVADALAVAATDLTSASGWRPD